MLNSNLYHPKRRLCLRKSYSCSLTGKEVAKDLSGIIFMSKLVVISIGKGSGPKINISQYGKALEL